MGLIYFSLVCAGLTQILVYGKIFSKIRPKDGFLGDLFSCPMCTGFWAGLFLWSLNNHTELFTFDCSLFTAFCVGCMGSLVSYIFAMIVGDCGIKIEHN